MGKSWLNWDRTRIELELIDVGELTGSRSDRSNQRTEYGIENIIHSTRFAFTPLLQ
ncbi:hypothetical protein LINPERPRIM_LOCUS394, partial [Linum perenne]